MKKQKPPVGRYFSRRSVSMWWRSSVGLVALRRLAPRVERGVVGAAARTSRTHALAGRGARPARPSRGRGQRSGSMKSAVVGHGLGAELADEAHHPRHRRGEARRGRARRRGTSRSRGGCRCRRAAAGAAARRCGRPIGRVSSACSNARFTQRSSTVLFHDGSCWPATYLAADLPVGVGRGRGPTATRLVVRAPHRRSTGGGRAGRRPRAPGAPPACGSCGRSPTAAGSPATAACRARRRRRTAPGAAMWPCTRRRGRARRRGPARRRARSSAGVASPSAMPRRRQVGALDEHPLAVDREHPVAAAPPRASPVRTLRGVADRRRRRDLDRRPSVSGWSPSDHGHHSRGSSMSRVQSTSLSPPASDCSCSVEHDRRRRGVRTRTVRGRVAVEPGVQAQVGARRRWRRGTAPAAGRCAPARCVSMRTGRHRPPGFHVGSMRPSAGTRR